MSSVSLSAYSLQFRGKDKARHGFLLRRQQPDFAEGYADIFPWVEFGDPDPKQIVELLKRKINDPSLALPPLLEKSWLMAERDGTARSQGRSLLNKSQILDNHFLITDVTEVSLGLIERALALGFTRFKLKVGRQWQQEAQLIGAAASKMQGRALWRLDCNLLGKNCDWNFLRDHLELIEYIEDPFAQWSEWMTDWPWAFDQAPFVPVSYDKLWQVIKPAKQNPSPLTQQAIYTSYLDHPLGQAHAFYEAYHWGDSDRVHGLMSQNIYSSNAFVERLYSRGPKLSFDADLGIGFTDLLQKQEWVVL
jgi:hypothetical protein